MTNAQAKDIVTLLSAATGGKVAEATVSYFEVSLVPLEYEPALSAATLGARTWRFFPSWADFNDAYRAQKKAREPVGEQRSRFPAKLPKVPEWVWVWSWAQNVRAPRCLRGFPQQLPWVELAMSMEEYEALRAEWVEAGSPTAKNPIPLALKDFE